jgi:hypothetical protein
MRIFAYPLIIIALALGMSACGEEVKTVDWYKANPEARVKKLIECKNNPGELAKTPNCQNAYRAHRNKVGNLLPIP